MNDDFISASEIAEYLYCQRVWWYRLHGVIRTEQGVLEQGVIEHEILAQQVDEVVSTHRFAWRLLWIGIALLVMLFVARFLIGN